MKRHRMEKNVVEDIHDNGLLSKITKELLKLNHNNPIMGQRP